MTDVRLVRERRADVDPMTFFDHRKVYTVRFDAWYAPL